MEVFKADSLPDRRKMHKDHKRINKHVKIPKENSKNEGHERSTSNNRAATKHDKYKQGDISGPITAKTSKLPDAFLDINYKGKRSMKSVNKESEHNNNKHVVKSSHSKSK